MQACCRPAGRGSLEARHSTVVLNSCCVLQVLHDLNQLVDKESMRLALQFCHAADNPYFRLCYNSLGAYGTVNHLHFQVGPLLLSLLQAAGSTSVCDQSCVLAPSCSQSPCVVGDSRHSDSCPSPVLHAASLHPSQVQLAPLKQCSCLRSQV